MERISIFNYEAFYLDFLEGNLNEEDTSLLFDFLKLHPELEIELDELPIIDKPLVKMDVSFLDGLKQTDVISDQISISNAETFMITSLEGQLSATKEEELNHFLKQNPPFAAEFSLIQKLKLSADKSIVYPSKSALIQGNRLVLWPYIAAAASVLIFFFIYQALQTNDSNLENQTANVVPTEKKAKSDPEKNPLDTTNDVNGNLADNLEYQKLDNHTNIPNETNLAVNHSDETTKEHRTSNENAQKNSTQKTDKSDLEIAKISKKDIQISRPKSPEFIEVNVEKLPEPIADGSQSTTTQNGYMGINTSISSLQEMKNPIKPITNRLSEITKTEIDLRTAQGNNSRKGFYLKIGKFEIERKGH